jgi:glycerophosphoryl diester phosphodiesterase
MQIIGHRGASGYKPENTLASFQEAIAQGADMIELDVCALPSGQVVVMHDLTVNRTTNGNGPITDFTFAELQKLDAGGGQHVPLLVDVLDLIHKRLPINIEIKGGGKIALLVSEIIDFYVTQKGWSRQLFVVSSFDHKILRQFAALQPDIRLGVLFKDAPSRFWAASHKHTVFSANMDAATITRESVVAAHKRGYKVYAYTINSKQQAKRLRAMKVDGIFTNYPEKLLV